MSVRIRPMGAAEYDKWAPLVNEGYVRNMIDSGGYGPDAAAAKARADFAQMLPDGLATAGHSVYVIEDESGPAGDLWVGERDQDHQLSLFVYSVHVRKERRGRGLARAAMLFTEDEARRRGIQRVSLNVFGGNHVARSLYRSLGYFESAVTMTKDL